MDLHFPVSLQKPCTNTEDIGQRLRQSQQRRAATLYIELGMQLNLIFVGYCTLLPPLYYTKTYTGVTVRLVNIYLLNTYVCLVTLSKQIETNEMTLCNKFLFFEIHQRRAHLSGNAKVQRQKQNDNDHIDNWPAWAY